MLFQFHLNENLIPKLPTLRVVGAKLSTMIFVLRAKAVRQSIQFNLFIRYSSFKCSADIAVLLLAL